MITVLRPRATAWILRHQEPLRVGSGTKLVRPSTVAQAARQAQAAVSRFQPGLAAARLVNQYLGNVAGCIREF